MRMEIAHPSEALFLRDLAVATSFALALEAKNYDLSVEWVGDALVLEGSEELLAEALRMTFDTALSSLEDIRRIGLRVPVLHQNDKGAWNKRLSSLGPTPADYAELAEVVIKWALNRLEKGDLKVFVDELSFAREGADEVILGRGTMVNLQPFKVEKYEYGKGFSDFRVKYDVFLGLPWLAYVAAGFVLTFSAYVGGEMVYSLVHDRLFSSALSGDDYFIQEIVESLKSRPQRIVEAFFGPSGILGAPRTLKLSPDPLHAYLLLLSWVLVTESFARVPPESLPFMLTRVAVTGKTYTLIERATADVKPLVEFAAKLSDEDALNFVRELASCTIRLAHRADAYCSRRVGNLSNALTAVTALYRAVIGSMDKYSAVYTIARSMGEGVLRSSVVRALLSALP